MFDREGTTTVTTQQRGGRRAPASDAPFPEGDQDAKAGVALQVRLAEPMAEDAAVQVYTPGEQGAPIQVDQDVLIGQPFAITGLRMQPVVGNYETGEISYHLMMVSAVPVKLDTNRNITKAGRLIVFIAGRVDPMDSRNSSVLGADMQEIDLREPSPTKPVLIPSGLRKQATAAGGAYYTIRPEAAKNQAEVDLFPD